MKRLGPLLLAVTAAAQSGMRVASLNLAKKSGPEIVSRMAGQPDLRAADILLLQEVVDGPTAHVAAEIGAALGLHVIFVPAFRLNRQFEEGLAILSRYPLTDTKVTSLPHNFLYFHTRIRIVVAAAAATPSGPVRIVNTHLDNRINAGAKRAQLGEIWENTDKYSGACIVGGDFNTGNFFWISHLLPIPGVQSLNRMLRSEMAGRGFRTPLGAGPGTLHFLGLKLDWIYLRGLAADQNSVSSGVTPIIFSDHNSVWVSIEVK